MTVAYTVLEYGDLIVAALTASDRLCFIYDVDDDVRQIIDTIYGHTFPLRAPVDRETITTVDTDCQFGENDSGRTENNYKGDLYVYKITSVNFVLSSDN